MPLHFITQLTTKNKTMNGDSQKRMAAAMVSHPPCSSAVKESDSLGLMGVAHTPEEAKEIKRRVESVGLWRDVEICDGLDELADYAINHRKKKE